MNLFAWSHLLAHLCLDFYAGAAVYFLIFGNPSSERMEPYLIAISIPFRIHHLSSWDGCIFVFAAGNYQDDSG